MAIAERKYGLRPRSTWGYQTGSMLPDAPKTPHVSRTKRIATLATAAALALAMANPTTLIKGDSKTTDTPNDPDGNTLITKGEQSALWNQRLILRKDYRGNIVTDPTSSPQILQLTESFNPATGKPVYGYAVPFFGTKYGDPVPTNSFGFIRLENDSEGGLWFQKTNQQGIAIDENGNIIERTDQKPVFFQPKPEIITNLSIPESVLV